MSTLGRHLTEQGTDLLCHELDRILARVIRRDPRLLVEPAGADKWTVVDVANGRVRMLPPTSLATAARFALAFVEKTEGASLDRPVPDTFSVRADVLSEREASSAGGRAAAPVARGATTHGSDRERPRSESASNVVPIRRATA